MFSRFIAAAFISNKQGNTVGEMMLARWVSMFGPHGMCHSDRGGEFVNQDLTNLYEYLNKKQTATAW